MKAIQLAALGTVLCSAMAVASPPVSPPLSGVKGGGIALQCPAGSVQAGGKDSAFEAVLCVRHGADGSREFHGPYVSFRKDGTKEAEGQYENGWRTGKWVFFDQTGFQYGETNFTRGDYDGVRWERLPNGQKKFEENWVMGKRQGTQKSWDAKGILTAVEFKDDHAVAQVTTTAVPVPVKTTK